MMETDVQRRFFLKAATGATVWALAPGVFAGHPLPSLFSAISDHRGRHYLCGWHKGELLFRQAVSERAHDCCPNPHRGEVLFFSRRPGQSIHVLDARTGKRRHTLISPVGSHFYGHGCLSSDGSRLYVTENDVTAGGIGRIAVYDCHNNYQRLGNFASGGTGPHQLAMMPDDRSLVVANGGILTLPQHGRRKLNLDSMQPNLSYIAAETGQLLASLEPPQHQLSLRHLDVTADGTVIVGAQFQGGPAHQWPLVFYHGQDDDQLQSLEARSSDWRLQQHYIASVAVSADNHWAVTTSPRGGIASLWNLAEKQLHGHIKVRDVAGAAFDRSGGHFVLSNGMGQLLKWIPGDNKPSLIDYQAGLQWDNHLLSMES